MIGRGFHGGFHGGGFHGGSFHGGSFHAGHYGFGDLWILGGGLVVFGVIAAAVWILGRLAPRNYDAELARQKQELGLPPD